MFYQPSPDDPWVNRLTAYFKGPYSHVELSFENGFASSVMAGECVFYEPKNYSNMNYTVVTIPLTEEAYTSLQNFCKQAAREHIGLCLTSMFLSVLPFQIMPARKRATFCSRYVTEALQHARCDLVQGLNAMLTTPTGLYNILSNDPGRILDTVPGRLHREWAV